MKAKIILLILTSIFLSQFNLWAQRDSLLSQKWNVALNVNTVEPVTEAGFDYIAGGETRLFNPSDLSHQKDKSYSLGLSVSRKEKGKMGIRLAGKITNYKIDETYNFKDLTPYQFGSSYLIDDAHYKQSVISIMPGLFGELNHKRFIFNFGCQMIYKHYSPIKFQIRYTEYSASTDTIIAVQTYDYKQTGGWAVGIGPFAGLSLRIFKYFYIGTEFSVNYSYYKTGGTRTRKFTSSNGTIDESTLHNSYESYKFSTINSAINISITI
jgi:hypothetical protein